MFRLFISVIIILFVGILIYSIYNYFTVLLREQTKVDKPSPPIHKDLPDEDKDVDSIISEFEKDITIAEVKAESGIETSEKSLEKFKGTLDKVKEVKSKLINKQ